MSELLRAVMDANCVDKNIAFYTMTVTTTVTVGPGPVYSPRSLTLQCKNDCYFLTLGWALTAAGYQSPGGGWTNAAEGEDNRFQVVNLTTGRSYSFNGPSPRGVMNFNLNNFLMLPEYVLFAPNDLLQIDLTAQTVSNIGGGFEDTNITLMGIEYRMKG